MGKTYIFDLEWLVEEGNDIVLDTTKIHCAVFKTLGEDEFHTFIGLSEETNTLKDWLASNNDCTYIGHNILCSDLEVLRRVLGIPFSVGPDTLAGNSCTFVDTFTLSKRLFPDRPMAYYQGKSVGQHGLLPWSVRTGMSKPPVTDWVGLPYLHRCREDVLNTEAVYNMLKEELDNH